MLLTANSLNIGRTGLLEPLFAMIPKDEHPNYTLVRGAQSLATDEQGYRELAAFIAEHSRQPRLFNVTNTGSDYPIGHAHTASLARQRQVADVLFDESK